MGLFDLMKKKDIQQMEENNLLGSIASKWLDTVLKQNIPEEVKGFCLNLYDDGDSNWSMELVGTNRFDADDPDWPCDEVTDFGTRKGNFVWRKETGWDTVLEEMTGILKAYLENGEYAPVLKSRDGVGIGFVDGDVEILYMK